MWVYATFISSFMVDVSVHCIEAIQGIGIKGRKKNNVV